MAGSIGPTSYLPVDYGVGNNVASDEEYLATFREQAEALAEGGVDLFAVETMMFPQEAVAAIPHLRGAVSGLSTSEATITRPRRAAGPGRWRPPGPDAEP